MANGLNHFGDDQLIVLVSATFYQVDQSFFAKRLPIGIFRLGDAVGVTDKQISGPQLQAAFFVQRKRKRAYHRTVDIERCRVSISD